MQSALVRFASVNTLGVANSAGCVRWKLSAAADRRPSNRQVSLAPIQL